MQFQFRIVWSLILSIISILSFRIPCASAQDSSIAGSDLRSESVEQATKSGERQPQYSDTIQGMFFGPITPEQAFEHAERLQAARLENPDAEIPVDVALPPQPQMSEVYSEEDSSGTTVLFLIDSNGTKSYLPPTSAIFFQLYGPKAVPQKAQDQFASKNPSFNAATLALFVSPEIALSLLKYSSAILQTVLFPNSTSPFSVPTPYPCSTETCISPTYGNGSTAQKGDLAILRHDGYDYGASVIKENGKYKMWWCSDGHVSGDHMYYATANNPEGPWTMGNSGNPVFGPTGDINDFDGTLTCDASVVHVGGMYFMYYGGNTLTGSDCVNHPYSQTTRIGVAYSYDGLTWARRSPGVHVPPIVNTKLPCLTTYGAGHPSVTYVDGYFYMTFDDDTVPLASPPKVYGQYAIRSVSPYFDQAVEELTAGNTWTLLGNSANNSLNTASIVSFNYSWLPNTVNPDWAYSQATKEFIVSINAITDVYTSLGEVLPRGDASSIRVFNKGLSTQTHPVTHVLAQWIEGPALIHYGSGGILTDANCNNFLMRVINPGRDWDDPYDGTSTDQDMTRNGCELAFHHYLDTTSSNLLKVFQCGDFSYEGFDMSTGVASCRAWANGLGPVHADDYDADGISDPTVWRPSDQNWYTKRSTNASQFQVNWGLSGDQPIFGADYDGDRVADPAVKRGTSFFIRPSTGTCPSPTAPVAGTLGCSFQTSTWGSTDVPLPGDYDGDGLTDIAARSTSGAIRYIPSSGAVCVLGFTPATYNGVAGCSSLAGVTGDKPLVGDYDGDGKTDRAFQTASLSRISVYPSTGYNSSTICSSINMAFVSPNGPCYTNMSATTDVPITGFFDGDFKTDIMWWTAASGQYFKTWGQSSNFGSPVNFSSPAPFFFQFGLSGDIPLAKHFNTDSLTEPTVYRNGDWYVNKTSSTVPPSNTWTLVPGTTNVYKTQWGLSADKVEGLR